MAELLERFVVAFEKIAAALSGGDRGGCACAKVGDVLPDGGVVVEQLMPPAVIVPVGPEKMVLPEAPNYKGVTDYDTLRRLCQERKIAVPPRTKSTTLVKWLQQDDLAKGTGAAPQAAVAPPVVAAPVVHTDPAPVAVATPPPAEVDPFVEPPLTPVNKEITLEDVIDVAKKLKDTKGLDAVKRVVIEYGGVALIQNIPKDKLAVVYAAAQKELE